MQCNKNWELWQIINGIFDNYLKILHLDEKIHVV